MNDQDNNITATPPIGQKPDGALLHFLKEVPAWFVILIFESCFLGLWIFTQADFIPRLIDALVGALLASVVPQMRKQTNIKADSVQTDSVNTDNMPDAEIHADALNLRGPANLKPRSKKQ